MRVNSELLLIRAMTMDKEKYFINIQPKLKWVKNFEKSFSYVLTTIKEYYAKYPEHNYISKDELAGYYNLLYPQDIKQEEVEFLIDSIYEADVSDELINEAITGMYTCFFATELVNDHLMPYVERRSTDGGLFEAVQEKVNEYQDIVGREVENRGFDFADLTLLNVDVEEGGIPWPYPTLNNIDVLGPLTGGSFSLVVARPGAGKSSFIQTCISHFAQNMYALEDTVVKPILYLENEQGCLRAGRRLVSCFMDAYVRKDYKLSEAESVRLHEAGLKNVYLADKFVFSKEIEPMLNMYKPRVVIVDMVTQLDEMMFRDNSQAMFTAVCGKLRLLAQKYDCDIIGAAQAGNDAYDKLWVDSSMIFGSKTGVAGNCDNIFGLGYREAKKAEEASQRTVNRYFQLAKSKSQGEGTRFIVDIDKWTGKATEDEKNRYDD